MQTGWGKSIDLGRFSFFTDTGYARARIKRVPSSALELRGRHSFRIQSKSLTLRHTLSDRVYDGFNLRSGRNI